MKRRNFLGVAGLATVASSSNAPASLGQAAGSDRPSAEGTLADCLPLRHEDRFDWLLGWRDGDVGSLIGKVIRLGVKRLDQQPASQRDSGHPILARSKTSFSTGC